MDKTIDVLTFLARELASIDIVVGILILNKPPIQSFGIEFYTYARAIDAIREVSPRMDSISTAFQTLLLGGGLCGPRPPFVAPLIRRAFKTRTMFNYYCGMEFRSVQERNCENDPDWCSCIVANLDSRLGRRSEIQRPFHQPSPNVASNHRDIQRSIRWPRSTQTIRQAFKFQGFTGVVVPGMALKHLGACHDRVTVVHSHIMMTLQSCFQTIVRVLQSLLVNPEYFWLLATLTFVCDAILTKLIIHLVPYTEIDWETYMIQTKVVLHGQHNYSLITGPTGALVYPAGHVRIHQLLYEITNSGSNIRLGQHIYALLYLATFILSCSIYRSAGNIPNWVILLLPLSKRLHSIFVLRLFNDCWSVLAIQAAILAFQNNFYDTGILLFSAALSVKMSILLYLPGLLVILFKRRGLLPTMVHMVTLVTTQILFAAPFLREDAWAYAQSAFNLGRVFLYKWTVNWRFIEEDVFLSSRFAITLLVGHVTILILFGLFKWCELDGGVYRVLSRGIRRPLYPPALDKVDADYVATVLFTSNLIGISFSRSLHYQFYSWYAQQVPFLAWRTRYPLPVKLAIIFGIEYTWNVIPSTSISSGILLASNILLVIGVWFGYPSGRRAH